MKGNIVYAATSSHLRLPRHDSAETGGWAGRAIKPQSWSRGTRIRVFFIILVATVVVLSFVLVKNQIDSATEDQNIYTQTPPPPPPPMPPMPLPA